VRLRRRRRVVPLPLPHPGLPVRVVPRARHGASVR
jgi:hypothetical protein